MSGGRFEYKQFHIREIREAIEAELENMGKEIPRTEQWHDEEWLQKYPKDRYYPEYKPETVREFKKALKILKLAYIYAQRIDWFLSGDDGEDSFHERLNEEVRKIKLF